MRNIPNPEEIYKHFKGNLYKIITLAKDTETKETMVVYQALYGDYGVYVRSLDMFMSKVDRQKYPEVLQEYRFELQAGVMSKKNTTKTQSDENITKETQKGLDPLLEEFLEADSYDEKLNILVALHDRITDDMITTLALVLDVTVEEGALEERYMQLKNCILTFQKYECSRP